MKAVSIPSWAVSFADLALLLLGCFVLSHALQPPGATAAAPLPAGGAELTAAELFEPGEARLTPAGRAVIERLAPGKGRPRIVSRGEDRAGSRYDGFELAAARAAAAARALAGKGAAPAEISVEAGAAGPQRLAISFR